MNITLESQIKRYFDNKERLANGLGKYIILVINNYINHEINYSNPVKDEELAIELYGVFNILLE